MLTLLLRSLSLLGLAVMSGCAGTPVPSSEDSERTVEAILDRPFSDSAYVKPERCISLFRFDDIDVLNDRYLLIRGTGDRLWINTLRHRCIGLRDRSTFLVEAHGGRLCSLDTISAIERFVFWRRTSATCVLGEFTPITAEQLAFIEKAIR